MGLLTSLLSLGIVVGLGYVTIKYIIPKIESGEFDLGGLIPTTTSTPAAASTDTGIGGSSSDDGDDDDVSSILSNLADTIGLPTTNEGVVAPEDDIKLPTLAPKGTKVASLGGKKKGKGEFLSSDLAGADNRKAGAKSGGSRRKKRGSSSTTSKKKSDSTSSSSSKKRSSSKDEDEEEEEEGGEEEEEIVEDIEKETIYFYYNNIW